MTQLNNSVASTKVVNSSVESDFFHICYQSLTKFLGDSEASGLIQRLHYWLQNDKVGYLLGDGCKWIFSTYQNLYKQFSWLSVYKIGRLIRKLESINWVISERYHGLKQEIGFPQGLPSGFQEYNQTKWYRLNYQQIYLDTGFEFNDTQDKPKQPKRSRRANVQNCTMQSTELHDAMCESAQSSIYKEIPISISQISEILEEKEKGEINQEEELDPWLNQEEQLPESPQLDEVVEGSTQEVKDHHEGECSAASGQGFTKINKPQPKEKEVWEIAPKRPYPVFLNWWADKKYKPQGGKWEVAASSNAYSEFYKDCDRTSVSIFPEFLEYMQQVAENCNQQLANGIKALLPSSFVSKPESTRENINQLMQNISELVERGVQVALPSETATPSCNQSIEFAIATGVKDIAAIKVLKSQEPNLLGSVDSENEQKLLNLLAAKQASWRNLPGSKTKIEQWANNTPGVMMSPDGPVLSHISGCTELSS